MLDHSAKEPRDGSKANSCRLRPQYLHYQLRLIPFLMLPIFCQTNSRWPLLTVVLWHRQMKLEAQHPRDQNVLITEDIRAMKDRSWLRNSPLSCTLDEHDKSRPLHLCCILLCRTLLRRTCRFVGRPVRLSAWWLVVALLPTRFRRDCAVELAGMNVRLQLEHT